MTHDPAHPSRRAVLSGAAATAVALSIARQAQAFNEDLLPPVGPPYKYEIQRSEAEWRARLTGEEFHILREGGTEFPTTSPYWNTDEPGLYHCKGCDLPLYASEWYSPQTIGFVFFHHAAPDAVLTGIHKTTYNGVWSEPKVLMEVHCRRCGSHLGHILLINGEVLHCINGSALALKPGTA